MNQRPDDKTTRAKRMRGEGDWSAGFLSQISGFDVMGMPYRFVEGLTTADIAFEARGRTLEELFASAADALTNTQVDDLKKIATKTEKEFTVTAPDIERLLYNFLEELVFYKDAEQLVFRRYKLQVEKDADGYRLTVKANGEVLNPKKHSLVADVKAVSWHKFKVEKTEEGWKAVVIVDV